MEIKPTASSGLLIFIICLYATGYTGFKGPSGMRFHQRANDKDQCCICRENFNLADLKNLHTPYPISHTTTYSCRSCLAAYADFIKKTPPSLNEDYLLPAPHLAYTLTYFLDYFEKYAEQSLFPLFPAATKIALQATIDHNKETRIGGLTLLQKLLDCRYTPAIAAAIAVSKKALQSSDYYIQSGGLALYKILLDNNCTDIPSQDDSLLSAIQQGIETGHPELCEKGIGLLYELIFKLKHPSACQYANAIATHAVKDDQNDKKMYNTGLLLFKDLVNVAYTPTYISAAQAAAHATKSNDPWQHARGIEILHALINQNYEEAYIMLKDVITSKNIIISDDEALEILEALLIHGDDLEIYELILLNAENTLTSGDPKKQPQSLKLLKKFVDRKYVHAYPVATTTGKTALASDNFVIHEAGLALLLALMHRHELASYEMIFISAQEAVANTLPWQRLAGMQLLAKLVNNNYILAYEPALEAALTNSETTNTLYLQHASLQLLQVLCGKNDAMPTTAIFLRAQNAVNSDDQDLRSAGYALLAKLAENNDKQAQALIATMPKQPIRNLPLTPGSSLRLGRI